MPDLRTSDVGTAGVGTTGQRIRLAADVDIRVDDGGESASAHLGDAPGGLVLDIDNPAVLRQVMSVRRRALRIPDWIPAEALADTSLRMRSGGRDLVRIRFGSGGRFRVRPTPAGVLFAVRSTVVARRRSLIAVAAASLAVTVVFRHMASRPRSNLTNT